MKLTKSLLRILFVYCFLSSIAAQAKSPCTDDVTASVIALTERPVKNRALLQIQIKNESKEEVVIPFVAISQKNHGESHSSLADTAYVDYVWHDLRNRVLLKGHYDVCSVDVAMKSGGTVVLAIPLETPPSLINSKLTLHFCNKHLQRIMRRSNSSLMIPYALFEFDATHKQELTKKN